MYRARWFVFSALLLLILIGGAFQASARSVSAAPVVFFDITVSLEWQPGSDDELARTLNWQGCTPQAIRGSYLDDLQIGLRQAAMYIYDYTGGQMALRNIEIYTNGQHWADADIRILADNNFRPTAFVGGIVPNKQPFTSAQTGAKRVFYPAGMLLGRQWNGKGARCGAWSAAEGWRSIGHEWGHYALFLWDGYLDQESEKPVYCSSSGLWLPGLPAADPAISTTDSLMSYQYRADQLWGGDDSPVIPPSCETTPQAQFYGLSDWHAIQQFYAVWPPKGAVVDPREALHYLAIQVMTPQSLDRSAARIKIEPGAAPALAQAYLIVPSASGLPRRVIGQGLMVTGDRELFQGVDESKNARAAFLLEDWERRERRFYPDHFNNTVPLRVDTDNAASPKPSGWQPGVRIVPLVVGNALGSRVAGFRIYFTDCAQLAKRVEISYCPAGGVCRDPMLLSTPGGQGMATLWLPGSEEAASHGYFYLRDLDFKEETVTWYQLGGGVGPATAEIHAPLVDGPVGVDVADQNMPLGSDSNVLFTPMDMCSAGGAAPPRLPLFGPPIRVEPVVADPDGGRPWSGKQAPLQVRLNYSQDLLDRMGIDESRLVVLYLDKSQNAWIQLNTLAQSKDLDWIAVDQRVFSGRGSAYALAYR